MALWTPVTLLLAAATAFQLWIGADTRRHLDIRVRVPPDAVELLVVVATDDKEWRSSRHLDPPATQQSFVFRNLAEGEYTVVAAIADERGRISRLTRDVIVTQ